MKGSNKTVKEQYDHHEQFDPQYHYHQHDYQHQVESPNVVDQSHLYPAAIPGTWDFWEQMDLTDPKKYLAYSNSISNKGK